LLNADGQLVAQSDKLNPGDFPTEDWPADKYVRDAHELDLPGSLAPGTYRISVGLWLVEQGQRLPAVDATGRAIGDSVPLSRPLLVE
jgi:hypothetical protein